ncbi:hypothetical protein [Streptomyces cyaneofuscatus]|uniref:hypothetical protein n=1 Tax=Streptomyces cyaneofuscatus TaxID=66883 RepID=UPI0037B8C65E
MAAVVMAVFAPYVFRTESTVQAIAWSAMLVGTVVLIAVLVYAELLMRRMDRRTRRGASGT